MTTEDLDSARMAPLQELLQTSTLSRHDLVRSPSRHGLVRSPCSPTRRALFTSADRNRRLERRRNIALAENLRTVSQEEFKNKWNFDPVKMQPIQASNPNASPSDEVNPNLKASAHRYEWKLINRNSEEKHIERALCSLAPNSLRPLRLSSFLAHRNNIGDDESVSQNINSSSEEYLLTNSLNTEDLESKQSTEDASGIDSKDTSTPKESLLNNHESKTSAPVSLTEKPLETVGCANAEKREVCQKSISVITSNNDNCSSSTVVIDPTIQPLCVALTADDPKSQGNDRNTKQLKITDFTCQRKRVHSESSSLVTSSKPQAKRLRAIT